MVIYCKHLKEGRSKGKSNSECMHVIKMYFLVTLGQSHVLHVNSNDATHETDYNLYSTVFECRKPMVILLASYYE